MGNLINGINGPIKGKVGDVVGSSRNGVPYVKSKYKKRTKKISQQEKGNRNKFKEAQLWLKPLLPFVREGFKGYSQTSYGFIAAKSNLLLNAFEGEQPNIHINPALVQLSYGNLPVSADLAVTQVEPNVLKFTWNPGHLEGAHPDDQVMLLAYDVENKTAFYTITGQFRKIGSDLMRITAETGKTYHIYVAFTAADRSRQSSSVYLGEISV